MKKKIVHTYDSLTLAMDRAAAARDRGIQWMLAHIDSNGKPADSDKDIGWSRFPWALAQAGKLEAAAVMAWAEKSGQFKENGELALACSRNTLYSLAHYAIGAWLLNQHDVARRTMNTIRALMDQSGGAPNPGYSGSGIVYSDLCYTTQVGYAAVMTGTGDIADTVYNWLMNMLEQQPALDKGLLYVVCLGGKLQTEIPPGKEKAFLVDFSKPKQAYFHPGIAAAFLVAYAQDRNLSEPIKLAEKLLELNMNGTEQQFDDPETVQICKFGWGAGNMLRAQSDKTDKWLPEALRMAHWFADCQNGDGAWWPSSFGIKEPTVIDMMAKTAEHVMEVNYVLEALGFSKAQIAR